MEYLKKLIDECIEVLNSRIPSGSLLIYDQVDNIKYNKWVMNCITILRDEAPEHVEQIKSIYDSRYNLINNFEQIFATVSSAVEYIMYKQQKREKESKIEKRHSKNFNLDFLHQRLKDKCIDHFYSEKYDDAILNACKVVEVYTKGACQGK